MKKVIASSIICLFLLNCTKKEHRITEQNLPYIISQENEKFLQELKMKKIPPPPPGFYGYNQIIIDKNNNFYFYQKETIGWHCVTAETDTIPDFTDLEPNDIIIIPNNNVIDFIKQNVSSKDERHRMLVIGSQNDTIRNNDFKKIMTFINDSLKSKIRIFTIRKSTQEEDTVISYRVNNKYYNSNSIKWNEDRILFPFIKPKR